MFAMPRGVSQFRWASTLAAQIVHKPCFGIQKIPRPRQLRRTQSSNNPRRPVYRSNSTNPNVTTNHLAFLALSGPSIPTMAPQPVPLLKLAPGPVEITLRGQVIRVLPVAAVKRPLIAFMADGTLYSLARQLRHVANEMFGVRIYRTTTGSNFHHVDVVVFDEELSPLEVDTYMTARQAKNNQLHLIDEARRSARRIRAKMHRLLRMFEKPNLPLSKKQGRLDQISSAYHLSPAAIKVHLLQTLLNSRKEKSATSDTVPSIHSPLLSALKELSALKQATRVSMQAKSQSSLSQTGQTLPPWNHRLGPWQNIFARINNETTKQFPHTATAMTDLVAHANSILNDWKTYMLSENGFALIRIPHPWEPDTFLPKRCVLVPAWVKHTASPHEYGMIVRYLCEFVLEQWPQQRLARMAKEQQERVRELFLVPNSGMVENPFLGNDLWEMDLMFKKWKTTNVILEWVRKSAEKRTATASS